MKKTIRNVAFIGMLGIAAVGCTSEPVTAPEVAITSIETVNYSFGGLYYRMQIGGDKTWDDFMDFMLALAREGYEVTIFSNTGTESTGLKEKVIYTTSSESDAIHWATEMHNNGYTVSISFDKTTGIYTCTAVK